ncbi:unnamed protein product [Cylicocyclus nassatus]|uniref:Uncharacterized protein n=1 Tax=Cylicocyclus nassatus TaxID=53992 RepID=A0AA36GWL6_CYLNA|nr:unnamed protein product [Cylicocyclus nassatus]
MILAEKPAKRYSFLPKVLYFNFTNIILFLSIDRYVVYKTATCTALSFHSASVFTSCFISIALIFRLLKTCSCEISRHATMTSTKLEQLYKELDEVDAGTHPEYLASLKQIEQIYEEQREREQIAHELAVERIDYEYNRRKQQIQDDLERKEKELVQTMLADFDEMEKRIELEYTNMEVSRACCPNILNDTTKKTLRGRGGVLIEPPTYFNATPKPATPNITVDTRYLLTDSEIAEDVRAFSGDKSSPHKLQRLFEVILMKQKLTYDGKAYKQGEEVHVENLEYGKFPAKMDCITETVVSFKSTLPWDTRQIHASYSDLTEGRVQIAKKRNN